MNQRQKGEFIQRLEQKLSGTNSTEYARFLNECKEALNVEIMHKAEAKKNSVRCIKCDQATRVTSRKCDICNIPVDVDIFLEHWRIFGNLWAKAITKDYLMLIIGGILCAVATIGFFVTMTSGSFDAIPLLAVFLVVGVLLTNIGYDGASVISINSNRTNLKMRRQREVRIYEAMALNGINRADAEISIKFEDSDRRVEYQREVQRNLAHQREIGKTLCPSCHASGWKPVGDSRQTFSKGKAVAGTILAGPLVGVAGGLIGNKTKIWHCNKCGYQESRKA